jgi:multidrug efflux system membrane fusion protein
LSESSNKEFARPRRFGPWTIFMVLLLGAGGGSAFLWRHDFAASAKPVAGSMPIAVPVTAAIATTRDLHIERSGIGTVVALSSVDVKARVDGQVQSLGFKEGQVVKRAT